MVNLLMSQIIVVNSIEAVVYVALGFAPTFVAMEMAWKMGMKIGKRGEVAPVAKAR